MAQQKKIRRKKTQSKSALVRELDRVFSIYIRTSYIEDDGLVTCFTCGKRGDWTEMQNGHYISRQFMNTRWDEENCRVQCVGCNIFKNGNYTEYAYRLLEKIGKKGMDSLMKKKYVIRRWTSSELIELIEKYRR